MNPFIQIALLSAVLAISSPGITPPTPAAGYTIYVVKSGDTLPSVATAFSTTVQIVEQVNKLGDSATLVPGEKLQVPLPTPTTAPTRLATGDSYTVKSGDTLAAIASSFGVSVDDLAKANGIQDVDTISVGQVLAIPGKGTPVPLPDGIALFPPTLKQGNTFEVVITVANAVTATGTFNGADLRFISDGGKLFALAGISRGAPVGSYPVRLNLTKADGSTSPIAFSVRVNPTNYPVQDITLTPQMASLLNPAIEQAEYVQLANTISNYVPQQFWNGPFQMPLKVANPPISALFGERRSYNGGAVGICGHEGQDFAVDGGTPVYAPAGGIVALARPLIVRGNVVFINHGFGVFSGFFHFSEIDVKEGQRVNTGDLVGKVGTTGFSTGDHLHWSMWVPGVFKTCRSDAPYDEYVDPIEWTARTIP